MLNERKIARSYASAIFELAEENNLIEVVAMDMELVLNTLLESPELKRVLASPVLKSSKKSDVLTAIFSSHINELTMRFLLLLVKSLRVLYLVDIAEQYINLYRKYKGIRVVTLKSAVPIEDAAKSFLTKKLKEELKSGIELREIIDSMLIGGFVVQVDDQRYDASIRSKLNKLDRQFDINIYKKGF